MKITQVFGFSEDEIETLSKSGKILADFAIAFKAESEDEKRLDETTANLIDALKEVIGRF